MSQVSKSCRKVLYNHCITSISLHIGKVQKQADLLLQLCSLNIKIESGLRLVV